MLTSTPLDHQLLSLLSQHAKYKDFRHLKALAWMIDALICSSKINLSEWESVDPHWRRDLSYLAHRLTMA